MVHLAFVPRVPQSLLAVVFLVASLSGCVKSPVPDVGKVEAAADDLPITLAPLTDLDLATSLLSFEAPVLIDTFRPGGEPVIAVTPKGTLIVSAHPGDTHLFMGDPKPDAGFARSLSGQSMLWRSTDGGKTWSYVGLPGRDIGPRDAAYSRSDPDITIDQAGNIYLVHLYIPFNSVERSADDGLTWTGTPAAHPIPFPINDRPWITSWRADEAWLIHDGFLWKSVPGTQGLAYQFLGRAPVGDSFGNLQVDPRDGTLYNGQMGRIAYSSDGGVSWKLFEQRPDKPGFSSRDPVFNLNEPAVDGAGNVYGAYFRGGTLYYAVWTPRGQQYLGERPVAKLSGSHMGPWIVAGDEGRIGIAWLGSDRDGGARAAEANWFLYAAVVEGAQTGRPVLHVQRATEKPIHVGSICTQGVGCVVTRGDRRLGDFLSATIDAAGHLLIVSGATANTGIPEAEDGLTSRPLFVKQAGGPLLRWAGSTN